MKKILLSLTVVACSLLSFAQTNPMVWNNGRMQCAQPITNTDSLTYSLPIVESDTLQLILPRAVEREMHTKVTLPKYDTTIVVQRDTIYSKPYTVYAGYAASAFSVSDSTKVAFSKGNLQYTQSTKTWAFAENQYDMIGADNVSNSALADKIDLFGWSGSNTATQWGISILGSDTDYPGDLIDWGKNIGDGNTWRTLTTNEWYYLFKTRTNASSKYGVARINLTTDGSQYVNGLILLPDTWICPSGIIFSSGVSSSDGAQYYAEYQTFTLLQWLQLEQAGAVFLPAAGDRFRNKMSAVQDKGYYWSSTTYSTESEYNMSFKSDHITPQDIMHRYYGLSVRLVKDL